MGEGGEEDEERRGWGGGGGEASGISLKVRAKFNLQVQMCHVCCLKDAQLSIFI